MGARQKLNAGYFNGAVLLAAAVGWFGQSWVVFIVVLAALLVSSTLANDLRFRGRRWRSDAGVPRSRPNSAVVMKKRHRAYLRKERSP
jgi:hypothetical protein